MYFVDREKIEQTLTYMNDLLEEIQDKPAATTIEKLAMERIAQMTVEAVLDTGNMMIDGFIMRDPGGFDDIIDILIDEQVLPSSDEPTYKAMIQLRKQIVKDYLDINHQTLHETLLSNKDVLSQFSKHVRLYLDHELGTANAFSNS